MYPPGHYWKIVFHPNTLLYNPFNAEKRVWYGFKRRGYGMGSGEEGMVWVQDKRVWYGFGAERESGECYLEAQLL